MEILNTETITTMGDAGIFFIIVGIVIGMFGLVFTLAASDADDGIFILIGLFLMAGAGFLVYQLHDVGETSYKQHEVIVEDFNEIYEKGYEIVEQDGKIVTIKKEGAGE